MRNLLASLFLLVAGTAAAQPIPSSSTSPGTLLIVNGNTFTGTGNVFGTNGATPAGNSVLNFSTTPNLCAPGVVLVDESNVSAIPAGTTVSSCGTGTITMTNAATGAGVASSDQIGFNQGLLYETVPTPPLNYQFAGAGPSVVLQWKDDYLGTPVLGLETYNLMTSAATGKLATPGGASSPIITFGSIPSGVASGAFVTDVTNPAAIPANTYVFGINGNNVILSSNPSSTIPTTDTLSFGPGGYLILPVYKSAPGASSNGVSPISSGELIDETTYTFAFNPQGNTNAPQGVWMLQSVNGVGGTSTSSFIVPGSAALNGTAPADLLLKAPLTAYSTYMRLLTAYAGPIATIYRDDAATQTFYPVTANGWLSITGLHAFCDGHDCYYQTIYDQGTLGLNLTNTPSTTLFLPPLGWDTNGLPIVIETNIWNAASSGIAGLPGYAPWGGWLTSAATSALPGPGSRTMYIQENNSAWSPCCESFGYSSTATSAISSGFTFIDAQTNPNMPTSQLFGGEFEFFDYALGAYSGGYQRIVGLLKYTSLAPIVINASQAGSGNSITFSSVPTTVYNGMTVTDVTNPSAISAAAVVLNHNTTVVNLGIGSTTTSAAGVASGDVISIGNGTVLAQVLPNTCDPAGTVECNAITTFSGPAAFEPDVSAGGTQTMVVRLNRGTDTTTGGGRFQSGIITGYATSQQEDSLVMDALARSSFQTQPGSCAASTAPLSGAAPNLTTPTHSASPVTPQTYYGTPSLNLANTVGLWSTSIVNPNFIGSPFRVRVLSGSLAGTYDVPVKGCDPDQLWVNEYCPTSTSCTVPRVFDQSGRNWTMQAPFPAVEPYLNPTGVNGKPAIAGRPGDVASGASISFSGYVLSGTGVLHVTSTPSGGTLAPGYILTGTGIGSYAPLYSQLTTQGSDVSTWSVPVISGAVASSGSPETITALTTAYMITDMNLWSQMGVSPNNSGFSGLEQNMTLAHVFQTTSSVASYSAIFGMGASAGYWIGNQSTNLEITLMCNTCTPGVVTTGPYTANQAHLVVFQTDQCGGFGAIGTTAATCSSAVQNTQVSLDGAPPVANQTASTTINTYLAGGLYYQLFQFDGAQPFKGLWTMSAVWNDVEPGMTSAGLTGYLAALHTMSQNKWGSP